MDPFRIPRTAVMIVLFGWSLWVQLLGPKRAKTVVFGGMALSTIAVLVVEGCGLA